MQQEHVILFDLFADAAPGVVEDRVLITRNRGVQLLQDDLHTANTMHKATDVVHHGSLTEHTGTLVRWPGKKHTMHAFIFPSVTMLEYDVTATCFCHKSGLRDLDIAINASIIYRYTIVCIHQY